MAVTKTVERQELLGSADTDDLDDLGPKYQSTSNIIAATGSNSTNPPSSSADNPSRVLLNLTCRSSTLSTWSCVEEIPRMPVAIRADEVSDKDDDRSPASAAHGCSSLQYSDATCEVVRRAIQSHTVTGPAKLSRAATAMCNGRSLPAAVFIGCRLIPGFKKSSVNLQRLVRVLH